jgi:hypothetical protein
MSAGARQHARRRAQWWPDPNQQDAGRDRGQGMSVLMAGRRAARSYCKRLIPRLLCFGHVRPELRPRSTASSALIRPDSPHDRRTTDSLVNQAR